VTSLSKLNDASAEAFVASLGHVYEDSPWVALRSHQHGPFQDRATLIEAMRRTVELASDEEKLALIRAHPDLAGKLARSGDLTAESTREQAGLGLDRLGDREYERFHELNTRYRERFGFPFIICARLTDKAGVLAAFEARLDHAREAEIAEALAQIHHIARLRIEDAVE